MVDDYALEDSERLLLLLKEYTEKLKIVIYEHRSVKQKQKSLSSLFALLSVTLVPFLYFFYTRIKDNNWPLESVILTLTIIPIFSMAFGYYQNTVRKTDRYDIYVIAKVLERLVRTASSLFENLPTRITNRFEYDIRLAEAEAALKIYRDQFGDQYYETKTLSSFTDKKSDFRD